MSSLLQHRGTIKNGKVQLLFTLEHRELGPFRCSNCGEPNPLAVASCRQCGAVVTMFFDHSRDADSRRSEYFTLDETIIEQLRKREKQSCYLVNRVSRFNSELVELARPDGTTTRVPKLYEVYRKPVGMFGAWVMFRFNNDTHAPDLSVPISVEKLPRDAKPLTEVQSANYWFK